MMMIPQMQQQDPALMLFAENFKNQCIAMSQYYAAHPEARVESPEPQSPVGYKTTNTVSVPTEKRILLSAFPASRKDVPAPVAFKPVEEFENQPAAMINDEVLDLLDQLDNANVPVQQPLSDRLPEIAPQPAPVPAKKQSPLTAFLKTLSCGRF
jgi:hypothetical protein